MNGTAAPCRGAARRSVLHRGRSGGFTLIEMMIVVAIVAILAMISLPSYRQYVIRASRDAAQSELIELAGRQEKIFLNASAFSSAVSTNYDGSATGGLGVAGATTRDGRYTLSVTVAGASFTLTATPVAGGGQAGDGNLTLDSEGQRIWGSKTW